MSLCRNELLAFLKKKSAEELRVVGMPDFFIDRIINIDYNMNEFNSMISNLVERKGGSEDGIKQTDLCGGNAINVASALASLGANITPIVCTNNFGLQQIRYHLAQYIVDTSHVKILSKASMTTALEFKTNNEKVNVMLRDVGSLADFGPEDLKNVDWEIIENADYMCIFNWAGTRNHGTELAKTVFEHVKNVGKGKTYFDTADPSPNKTRLPQLMQSVLKNSNIDILSLNENEAVIYGSMLDEVISEKSKNMNVEELALDSARVLAKYLPARIDLHATKYSASLTSKREVIVPSFKVKVFRATGAGDTWDAGNIIGDGNGLSDECRLTLANAAAAYYISNPDAMHPTRQKLARFIEKTTMLKQ